MDATKAGAKADAEGAGEGAGEGAAKADDPPCAAAERARAHAYLDLWERHVVHVALYGPAPGRAPA